MRSKLLAATAIALASFSAYAGDYHHPAVPQIDNDINDVDVNVHVGDTNITKGFADADAKAIASAHSKSDADANSKSSANNSISFNSRPMKYAPTVIAPGLTAGINPCTGSISGGGSFHLIGAVFGTTRRDRNCEVRALAEELARFGQGAQALRLLCNEDEGVRKAFADAGTPCESIVAHPEPVLAPAPVALSAAPEPAVVAPRAVKSVKPKAKPKREDCPPAVARAIKP